MKTKIVSQKKNPFLNREEFEIEIESSATPKVSEVVEDLGKDENLTIVRKIKTSFGATRCVARVVVYDSLEDKEKNEVIPQKVRKKIEEERKKREAEEKKRKEEEEKKRLEEEKAKNEQEENTEEVKEQDS